MDWNNERALNRLKSFCIPRLSGTPNLIKARDIIFNDLKTNVKSTTMEEFKFHNEFIASQQFWEVLFLSSAWENSLLGKNILGYRSFLALASF